MQTVARGPSDAIRASERVSPAIARPEQKTHANQRRFLDRGTARDRPSPYGDDAIILLIVEILKILFSLDIHPQNLLS